MVPDVSVYICKIFLILLAVGTYLASVNSLTPGRRDCHFENIIYFLLLFWKYNFSTFLYCQFEHVYFQLHLCDWYSKTFCPKTVIWNVFVIILFIISQHWFRQWLGASRHQAISWTNIYEFHWCCIASLADTVWCCYNMVQDIMIKHTA